MYDTTFIVKYKSIEEELIDKIKNGTQDYTEDDVYTICEELYKHELRSVFQIEDENTEYNKMQDIIVFVWNKMQLDQSFVQVVSTWRKKILLDTKIPDIECFGLLFNYDYFFLLHSCICECLENKPINVNDIFFQINKL